MAQVLSIPQPARFSRSYVAIWGAAEFGKSLVAGIFGALLLFDTCYTIVGLVYSALLQVADQDELRSGVRREGSFFGINALIGLIPGIAMFLAALLLMLYPLRGRTLEKMQADVLALHAAKHAMLLRQEAE